MSITVILEAQAKPGRKTDFLKRLLHYLPDTYKFHGFIDITIFSEGNEDSIVFISQWQTLEDYQRYLQWRVDTGVMEDLETFLVSTPVIRPLTQAISSDLELI